jgi:hypothetical protein
MAEWLACIGKLCHLISKVQPPGFIDWASDRACRRGSGPRSEAQPDACVKQDRILLFLKKKKQKDFYSCAVDTDTHQFMSFTDQ